MSQFKVVAGLVCSVQYFKKIKEKILKTMETKPVVKFDFHPIEHGSSSRNDLTDEFNKLLTQKTYIPI